MTVTAKPLVDTKYVENVLTAQYAANNLRAIIDKVTVCNVSASIALFSAHITSGAADNSNLIVDEMAVSPGESMDVTELAGQYLEPSDALITLASALESLTIRVNGREITVG